MIFVSTSSLYEPAFPLKIILLVVTFGFEERMAVAADKYVGFPAVGRGSIFKYLITRVFTLYTPTIISYRRAEELTKVVGRMILKESLSSLPSRIISTRSQSMGNY